MLRTDKTAFIGRVKDTLSVVCGTAVLIVCLSVLCAFSIVKNVEIDTGYGRVIPAVTMKATVGEILDEQQITLNKGDIVSPSVDTEISHKDKITIRRSVGVKITADGDEKTLRTTARDVQQALSDAQVILGEYDECSQPLKDKLYEGMEIVVTRVEKVTETTTEPIAHSVVTRKNDNLAYGVKQTVQKGIDGVLTKSYTVTKRDGVEISREFIGEVVTTPATDEIVEVGNKFQLGAVIPRDQLQAKASIVMNATAYDAGFESCGKYPGDPAYGITATGMQACYGVVAVDPNVIPLGTKLYVTSPDGSIVYGCAIAADTGGAIRGNKIDLFYNSRSEALQFGRRSMVVYIL